ncbi:MAG TPA: hypothetical protein VFO66_03350, partial [Gemmatimonadaceae bacterium]|nr:hypothetical protein [Gemmatimonadaceae bacterium]
DFKCPDGHVFEKFYPSITSKRRVKCPECGKPADRMISGGAGLVFKGSCFYITDYKRAGEKTPKNGSSEGESKASESSKPKKDSPKPDK